jgi:hypothetical protein
MNDGLIVLMTEWVKKWLSEWLDGQMNEKIN